MNPVVRPGQPSLDRVGRRACEIYATIDSPNWYGHALYYLGILVRYEGDFAQAVENLTSGARRLEDVGDMNCWAGAIRHLATCEAALGQTGVASERLVAVIDSMPVLPMQEIVKPRTLDSAAEVLLVAERHDQAGVLLGAALAVELPAEYGTMRDPQLEAARRSLVEVVGESEAERLISEGGSLTIDDALAKAHGWLAAA